MYLTDSLHGVSRRLAELSETPSLDSQVLHAHVLNEPRAWILAHPEFKLGRDQESRIQIALDRLEGGEPLPYVLGHWEFFGLDFKVTPDVLIPRPETEGLVERALGWLSAHPKRRRAADVGTGSGCIAIALAARLHDLNLLASDVSGEALEVARLNADRNGVAGRIQFVQADLLNCQPSTFTRQPFDLIVANLPYIPSGRLRTLDVARREPVLALDGGEDGLDLIRRLVGRATAMLAAGGAMLLEIDSSQSEALRAMAAETFPGARVAVYPDLAGFERVIEIQTLD
jgi:release factor glutamine methyltransferase